MGGQMSGTPDGSFNDRLNRVAEKRGPVEQTKPPVEVLPDWRDNISGPAGYAAAFAIGIVAVLIVRLVRFHVFGGSLIGSNPDLTMAIDCFAGFAIGLIALRFLPFSSVPHGFAQFGGVVTMLLFMHGAVHGAPILFKLAFSPEWTQDVIAQTEPGTMLIRGQSVPFSAPAEDEDTVVAKASVDDTDTAGSETEAAAPAELPKVRKEMSGSLIKR